MARRRSATSATGGNLDSMLDTLTNVVGILVIVLVTVQLSSQEAASRLQIPEAEWRLAAQFVDGDGEREIDASGRVVTPGFVEGLWRASRGFLLGVAAGETIVAKFIGSIVGSTVGMAIGMKQAYDGFERDTGTSGAS